MRIQLLENPDAEQDLVAGSIPGWTDLDGVWGYRSADPPPHSGNGTRYFFAGVSANTFLTQVCDVSAYAAVIDAGEATATWSGWMGSWPDDPRDESRHLIQYRDANNVVLSSFDTGFSSGGWREKTDSRVVPANTRNIRVLLFSQRLQGNNNDGYHDNLSLILEVPDPEPEGVANVGALLKHIARRHLANPGDQQAVDPIRQAMNEVAQVPLLQGRLVENVKLSDGAVVKIKHGLGRKLRGWVLTDLYDATSTGRIVRVRTSGGRNASDESDIWLRADGWGATITVGLWVF